MASDSDGGARDTTVIFVDLVSFTSLTDVHGDEAGADAAEALARMASAAVDGVRLVTAAGDGVLLTAESPVGGAAAIVEGVHDLGFDARGGVAHGPVVERDGDVFGSTVNLAARLAGQSRAGRLSVTRLVAEAVGPAELSVSPLGTVEIRGLIEPVELFEIDPCAHGGGWLDDPVCGMRIRETDAVSRPDGVVRFLLGESPGDLREQPGEISRKVKSGRCLRPVPYINCRRYSSRPSRPESWRQRAEQRGISGGGAGRRGWPPRMSRS